MTDQTEHALLVTKVGVGGMVAADLALSAGNNGGDELIADLDGIACGIELDVLTQTNDLTRALVTENDGDQSEGIALPLVHVGAAYAAALDTNEDIVILKHFGNGKFLDLNMLGRGQHCDLSDLIRMCGHAACTRHFAEDLTYNAFYLYGIQIHFFVDFLS